MKCKLCNNSASFRSEYCVQHRYEHTDKKKAEYQKKYRQKNKIKLDKYHLDYMREKRWLNGSENYSGELG